MWRSGGNTRLLRKRSRVRFPHSAIICVHKHVCLYWVWVFLCIICMCLQKKCKQVCIYPLSRIFNTSLISAYFGLDSRECKCLEYLFIINEEVDVSHWMGDQKFIITASPCFGRYVNPLVPAAFAVVSTHQPALGMRGG
jgi:hypothetical protein